MALWVISPDGEMLGDVQSGALFIVVRSDGDFEAHVEAFGPTDMEFAIFHGNFEECKVVLREIGQCVCQPQVCPLAFGEGTKRQAISVPDDDDDDDDDGSDDGGMPYPGDCGFYT